MIDELIVSFDRALRTLTGTAASMRPYPAADYADTLAAEDRKHSAGLMRVNHTGEVCAQALYSGHALTTNSETLRREFLKAAQEEEEHLAWTQQRLEELNARTSLLNPLWYAGSYVIGAMSGVAGDRLNLGFVVETERQVEDHLLAHLERLPESDHRSKAIVAQMRLDEARHGTNAQAAGAMELPLPVKWLMKLTAKVMTTTAYRL